jgi:hypothetical protein
MCEHNPASARHDLTTEQPAAECQFRRYRGPWLFAIVKHRETGGVRPLALKYVPEQLANLTRTATRVTEWGHGQHAHWAH